MPTQNQFEKNEPDPEVTAYAWGGAEIDHWAEGALAKKSRDPITGRTRYFLKRATSGPNRGFLYNPQGLLFSKAAVKRDKYEYRTATRQAFDLYLKFLQTQNPLFLNQAERMT